MHKPTSRVDLCMCVFIRETTALTLLICTNFLLCREQHADRTAKDCKPWHQAPIGKWKANHHVPVWASIRHVNPGKLPRKPIPKSFKSTLLGSVEGNDSQAKQLQSLVEQKISTIPSTGGIADTSARLDWIMTSTISEVYSPDARDDHRLSQDPQVQLVLVTRYEVR